MTDPTEPPAKTASNWTRLLPVLVLAGGLILALSLGWHRHLSLQSLQEHRDWLTAWVADYGLWAGLAFTGLYALATAFSVPGGIFLTIGAGFLFGVVQATLFVVLGATLGATALFLAARTALADYLRSLAGGALKRMEAGFRENEMNYMLVLRLVPLFPFWLVNIVPAFLGVSLKTYVIATFFGIIPGTFVFASVGSTLGSVLDSLDPANPPDLGAVIFRPAYLLPIGGLIFLALLPVFYRRYKSRKEK